MRDLVHVLYVSLSAKIGDGRHICSRREQRGPYSPIERPPVNVSLSFIFLSCLPRSSGCEISIDPLHAYLSAMIGDGRHISSEARTRPLFADRAAAQVF